MSAFRLPLSVLLLGVSAIGATRATDAGDPALDVRAKELPASVDAIAKRWIDQGVVGLSIAVVRGDEVLVSKAYGRAHVELDVPTPDRAVYEIASEAKTFTAAAILKLVERGKLRLDDTLHRHLPGVMPDAVANEVTIRQLLTHTSGVFEYTAIPEFEALAPQALPREALVRLIAAQPLAFEPGTAQSYSNSGYLLLGLVVEKLSGKPWGKFVEDEIFPLAGMRDSRASWNRQVVPRMATGYEFDDEHGLRRAPHHEPEWIHGNGGLRATARDMTKWMRALHGGSVLGAASYREMTTPGKLADGTPLRYGLGVVVAQPLLGHRIYRHGGTFPGYTGYTAYLPDHDLAVSALVNTTRPGLDEDAIVAGIVSHLIGDRSKESTRDVRIDAADYTGEYRAEVLRSKRALTVGVDTDGRLTAMIPAWGEEPRPMTPLGNDAFTAGWLDFEFVRRDGVVVAVRRISSDTNILFER